MPKKTTPTPEPPSPLPTAYSYVRFSSPEQAEGDSLRRQTQKSEEWCEQHGYHLDTTLNLRDLGVSAFKGRHRNDKTALGQFLKLVERGRIAKGSYLIIENLDRLSREDERTALRLWMDILDAGVNIVQLFPETVFRHEKSDLMDVMRAIIELSRGHSESVAKSERLGAAWENKRNGAREGKVMTHRLPAWIEERDGKLHLIPERTAALKRIFQLAAAGYGHVLIAKKLREEDFPPFGEKVVRKGRKRSAFSGEWTRSYIALLLRDRRAVGELQPRLQDGIPDGEPILDYYPAVVTLAEWDAARVSANGRERRPVRTVPGAVNLFSGLLRDARSGETYFSVLRNRPSGEYRRVLSNKAAHAGNAPYYAFPADTFEAAILSCLREINPHEILNGDSGPDESLALAAELSRVDASIAAINADLDEYGDSPAMFKRLRDKEALQRELAKQLDEARQKAAHPASECWGETQSLLDALASAPDPEEARLRLRAALRRIVDSMWLLVVPRGRDRLAAVQVWFAGGERHRDYLIFHRPAKANASCHAKARKWRGSLKVDARSLKLDLRRKEECEKLERLLAIVPVEKLLENLEEFA